MKKTTLENLYDTLLNMKNEIILDEDTRKKALRSLENMHKLAAIRTTHILETTNKSGY
jgi:quinolinate synthase